MIDFYDYQMKAIDSLHSGSILCGGVGSGKSRTALGYYILKECKGSIKERVTLQIKLDLYIITTARKRDTLEWDKECAIFSISKDPESSIKGVKLTVDSWNNIHKYIDVEDAFFIFDEQRVVGSGAWAKSFIKIAKKNRWLLLSATPGDTWMDYIPVFIANGFYHNRTEFIKRHVVFSRFAKYPRVEKYIDEKRLMFFRDKILVNMDYLKTTESINEYINVSFDEASMNRIIKDRWNIYEDRPIKDAVEYCYVMRKLVNSDSSRIDSLINIVKEKKKVIVFYNFDYELYLLREMCNNNGFRYSEWNGHKHEAIKSYLDSWVYLVQYTAGAEGWNCIETNTIVFYSQNYSYKTMTQAAGRIDRLNSPYSKLYYYHLISSSQIDKAILSALRKKKKFNESSLFFYSKEKHTL